MNPFLYTILTFLFSLAATSCLKRSEKNVNQPCNSGCIVMNTHVGTGEGSLQPLSGAAIEVGWSKPATPYGDAGRLIATGTTNSAGDLQISFSPMAKELEGGRFYVSASKGNPYFQGFETYYQITKSDTTINSKVHVASKATLRIVYKNFHPTLTSDFFQACPGFQSYGSDASAEIVDSSSTAASCFFSSTEPFDRRELTVTTAGEQHTYIEGLILKNGIRTTTRDSIMIPKGETRQIDVVY